MFVVNWETKCVTCSSNLMVDLVGSPAIHLWDSSFKVHARGGHNKLACTVDRGWTWFDLIELDLIGGTSTQNNVVLSKIGRIISHSSWCNASIPHWMS